MKHHFLLFPLLGLLTACGDEKFITNDAIPPVITPTPEVYAARTSIVEGGSLSPSEIYMLKGDHGSFTVTPSEGYILGSISGCNGKLDKQTYTTGKITEDCTITPRFINDIESAIKYEDHTLASESELLIAMREKVGFINDTFLEYIDRIYLDAAPFITMKPRIYNVTVSEYNDATTFPILLSNKDGNGNDKFDAHWMLGEKNSQRFGFFGSHAFFRNEISSTDTIVKNTLKWLANKNDIRTIVVSNMKTIEYGEIREWLGNNMPDVKINVRNACDDENINSCIDNLNPDLFIYGAYTPGTESEQDPEAVNKELNEVFAKKIPTLISFTYSQSTAVPYMDFVREYFEFKYQSNYWTLAEVDTYPVNELKSKLKEMPKPLISAFLSYIDGLESGTFNPRILFECTNFLECSPTHALKKSDVYIVTQYLRNFIIESDASNVNLFDSEKHDLFKIALLLADKYRENIDYPILLSDSAVEWQRASFADSLVSYTRLKNIAQPDLGHFVVDNSGLQKGEMANFEHPPTLSERKTINVGLDSLSSDTWTSTGWYSLQGKPFTLKRHDNGEHDVEVIINFGRSKTGRLGESRTYQAPAAISEMVWSKKRRLKLKAGQSVTMSSPYGGPIYLAFINGEGKRSVDITATGVAHHPFIDDIYDVDKMARFERLLNETEIPQADVVTHGYEQHFRKDRLLDGIIDPYTDLESLLKATRDEHINVLYALAGFRHPGKTLAQSFSKEYLDICQSIFGDDCLNDTIHTRNIIQHANFAQNAQCGSGCGGNPYDSGSPIGPREWLDNNEMGRSLQIKAMEMNYVEEENKNNWSSYQIRTQDSSNSVFAANQKWFTHHIIDNKTDRLPLPELLQDKDLFFAFMSDANEIKNDLDQRVVLRGDCSYFKAPEGESRYEAPYKENGESTYLLHVYLQMILLADKMEMPNGATLENGFDIFPLLYQHARIFTHYSRDKATWDENRTRLGFSEFEYDGLPLYSGQKVSDMPGNDFLLVSLNHITKHDWSPFFSLAGLRYSDLAKSQAALNATKSAVPLGMYILDAKYPDANLSDSLTFLPLDIDKKETRWPLDNTSPIACSTFF